MEFDFKIEGLSELTEQLRSLEKLGKQKQLTQNALFYASQPIFDDIKARAPRAEKAYYRYYRGSLRQRLRGNPKNSRKLKRPGTLRRSIARKRIRVDGGVAVAIYIKPKAFYYRFIERGTPTIPAIPFVLPAYEHFKEAAVERFRLRYGEYVQAAFERKQIRIEQEFEDARE
ncbi:MULTISPECIES: HK97-gp10 family putative phage morphogenesis protein [Acinetobacter calcoaceticus/baumannii complex]|uniref:HK97-gp10 family putative phage morphogenesis protein n=1 Tax=Acinetobacter calcoaceticus/baumannii complex TaxID=909768 RepID=UPI0024DEFBD6|nr:MULTISPECIES: HK97-gp10 family putative phage morphogenesis protein [Acinetobacter calcoaceticus/baumannii complex]HAV4225464.1 hypothetical protein [Acinetobacter baumannii]